MFQITKDWIHENSTARHGWTKKQLEAIGVMWPPHQGWAKEVVGKQISMDQKKTFEDGRGT